MSAPIRIRRTAEDAKHSILDATERRLVAQGPSGVRLQDVAADVGIAHSTILHHFGSREHLIDEVVRQRVEAMKADVFAAVAAWPEVDIAQVLERLYDAFERGGHARVVAFMALEGRPNPVLEGVMPLVRVVYEGGLIPDRERAEFVVLLVTYGLFGEAVAGPMFRAGAEPEARRRFIAGLAELVRSAVPVSDGRRDERAGRG